LSSTERSIGFTKYVNPSVLAQAQTLVLGDARLGRRSGGTSMENGFPIAYSAEWPKVASAPWFQSSKERLRFRGRAALGHVLFDGDVADDFASPCQTRPDAMVSQIPL
jgi:hypothetical protein